jgi:phage pi2 protein 07
LGEVDDLSRNFVIHPEKVLIQQIENVGKVFYPEKFISFRAVNQLTGFLLRG